MVQKLHGRLVFINTSGLKQYNKRNYRFRLSLVGVLMGIFLLPNLAYLSDVTPEKIIELTNQQRQSAGLNELTANQFLSQAAENKGRSILDAQTFNHTINNKKFSSWVRDTGYNYSYVGENLAIDFVSSEGVIDAWDNSPLHKQNLLSSYYKEIGVATVDGKFQGQDTTIVVQIFGAPAVASARPLTPDGQSLNLNQNINFPNTNFANNQTYGAENLLTHSIITQELPDAAKNKFILLEQDNLANQLNKFFVQPKINTISNNLLLISIGLTLIYWLVYLYYYLAKINKQIFI